MNRGGNGPTQELTACKRAGEHDLLDDERRGKRAENEPEREDGETDGVLDRVEGGGRVNEFETRIGHEVEDALCHKRGDGPAQRPEQHTE